MVDFEPQQGFVQIPIQFLQGALSLAAKRQELEADQFYENSANVMAPSLMRLLIRRWCKFVFIVEVTEDRRLKAPNESKREEVT
jgi:hypothetical protein